MQILSIGKKKRIHTIAFSPNGEELAAVCGDRQIRIWNLGSGEVRLAAPVEETSCGYDIAYLDQDRLVFAGTQLRWWDTAADEWHLIAPGFTWGRARSRLAVPGERLRLPRSRPRNAHWPHSSVARWLAAGRHALGVLA